MFLDNERGAAKPSLQMEMQFLLFLIISVLLSELHICW